MYFQNMGAYTSAAASTFNGFPTTEKFYVCSVPPQHFYRLVDTGRVDKTTAQIKCRIIREKKNAVVNIYEA